jgi:hypothetical protein
MVATTGPPQPRRRPMSKPLDTVKAALQALVDKDRARIEH